MRGGVMGTVLITGSSRGIGKAIAFKFAKEGHNVIINGSRDKKDCSGQRLKSNSSAYPVWLSSEIWEVMIRPESCSPGLASNSVIWTFSSIMQAYPMSAFLQI